MKILKKFLNTSEFKSLKIIEKTLKNSKYKVFLGLPLYAVFSDKDNEFNREEKRYIHIKQGTVLCLTIP